MPLRSAAAIRLFLLIAALGGLRPSIAAEASKEENPTPVQVITSRMREDLLRMNDFFDTMLPGTLAERNIILKFQPKFSDLRDNEFIRFPFELRYGFTEKLELFGGMTPYTPNPFNRGRDHSWGFGEIRLGARYNLGKLLRFYDEATVGFEERSPLGSPPLELIDSYTHLRPFLSASRQLKFLPDTKFFTNFGYDHEVNTPGRSRPIVSKRHVAEVGPGLLYKPGEFGLFGEYRFRYIDQPMIGSHKAHDSKVGVLWDIPLDRSQKWNLPGKWQVEVAYKFDREEGYEDNRGITARVNWRTSLREVLRAPQSASARGR
jgi:hypothetical protein